MRRLTTAASIVLGIGVLMLSVQPAWAPYHRVVIEQIFFGTEDCPNARYVMLRTLEAGQIFVQGQKITVQGADGGAAGDFGTFSRALSRGQAGIPMDQVVSGPLAFPDGRVCFGQFVGESVDCVAYGAFTGDNPGGGSPAPAPQLGMALVRTSDTNENATDFTLDAPAPENNAGSVGTLGQCPAAATPTPTPVIGPTPECSGDCNDDGEVTIDEVVTGVRLATAGGAQVGSCPAMDASGDGEVTVDELIGAVDHLLNGCPQPPPGELGTRIFSVDPETSFFMTDGIIPLTFNGFTGELELTAGTPDPETGIAAIDITDTSEFLSLGVDIPGLLTLTLCLRIDRSQLPFENAGIVACNGGVPLGIALTQDHNIGVVGQNGFTAEQCTAMGGTLETQVHPGVCNGPFVPSLPTVDSGPGAVFIGPSPLNPNGGIPIALTMEDALPCGDEAGPAITTNFAFTTGRASVTILDRNNVQGSTFSGFVDGENFSCRDWTVEDGPGRLVLAAPLLDLPNPLGGRADILNYFGFED